MTTDWAHDDVLHAWWVTPRLLAGEYPDSLTAGRGARKRNLLLSAGIDSIVDLTVAGECSWGGAPLAPYAARLGDDADALGRPRPTHVRFAIPDQSTVADDDYRAIVAHLDAELAAGRTVYVHCWGGKGRTATVIGAWLILTGGLGWPGVQRRLDELRAGTKKAGQAAPENDQQRAVLARLAADAGR